MINGATKGYGHAMTVNYALAVLVATLSPADTTNRDNVESAAKCVQEDFGKLDILIGNAGYLSRFDRLLNIKGTYLMSRATIPVLLKSYLKTPINLSSEGAHGVIPGASAYMTTKLMICNLSEFLRIDYGSQDLLAYTVNVGDVSSSSTNRSWRKEWLAGRYVSWPWDTEELDVQKDEILEKDLLKVRFSV
ncbi:NAD(P)-binding protein [Viridothelium virens]|uniref:NAD(P)-binding protein n=1 Tax=Viridothelium virens TaxID=1048519 RepID=A0A6A6HIS3_VIRVR|nr:NAD(P)-binding protein [Viridothelium virens]